MYGSSVAICFRLLDAYYLSLSPLEFVVFPLEMPPPPLRQSSRLLFLLLPLQQLLLLLLLLRLLQLRRLLRLLQLLLFLLPGNCFNSYNSDRMRKYTDNKEAGTHLSRDLCVVIMIASPLVSYWGRPARPNT